MIEYPICTTEGEKNMPLIVLTLGVLLLSHLTGNSVTVPDWVWVVAIISTVSDWIYW